MTCIDDATRMVHIYGMAVKNHASEKFKKYIAWLKSETGCDVWQVRSDRGGEYLGTEFQTLLDTNHIAHQKTVGYAPSQNGVAE